MVVNENVIEASFFRFELFFALWLSADLHVFSGREGVEKEEGKRERGKRGRWTESFYKQIINDRVCLFCFKLMMRFGGDFANLIRVGCATGEQDMNSQSLHHQLETFQPKVNCTIININLAVGEK